LGRGYGVLQPQAHTLGARAIILSHIEFQGRRGGYAPGCEHLVLELSCPGVGARPASLTAHPGQQVC